MEKTIDLKKFMSINTISMIIILVAFAGIKYTHTIVDDTKTTTQSKPDLKVYRGVPMDHPLYALAMEGSSHALGGPVKTIYGHISGRTNSIFHTWTTNRTYAVQCATVNSKGLPCEGILLEKVISGNLLQSTKCVEKNWNVTETYVMTEPVSGAIVIHVKPI